MQTRKPRSIFPWAFAAVMALSLLGTGAAMADDDFVDVCVDEDRVMRIRDAGAMHCQGGERDLRLSVWQPEEPEEEPEEDPEEDDEEDRDITGKPFKAPFEVVDGGGNVIFRVDAQAGAAATVQVLRAGQALLELGAGDDGGKIEAHAVGGAPGVELTARDGGMLLLGETGGTSILLAASGVATIIEAESDGSKASIITLPGSGSDITLTNNGRIGVKISDQSGGDLTIGDAEKASVSLGVLESSAHIVLAGQKPGLHLSAGSNDAASMMLFAEDGRPAVDVNAKGQGSVTIGDPSGSTVAIRSTGSTSTLLVGDDRRDSFMVESVGSDTFLLMGDKDKPGVFISSSANTAPEFTMHTADGTPVVTMDASEQGNLTIGDRNRSAIVMGSSGDGSRLALSGSSGPAIALAASSGEHPSLSLFYTREEPALVLGGYDGRPPGLRINSQQGQQVAAIGMDDAGNGAIRIRGAGAEGGVDIDSGGGAAVSVIDPSGRTRAAMQILDAGRGALQVHNSAGQVMSVVTQGDNGGQLQIANNGGTPMVEAGVIPNGVGVVRTGPGASLQTSMTIPSFIMGKVAGQ